MRNVAVVHLGLEVQLRRRETCLSEGHAKHLRVIIGYSDFDLEFAAFIRASSRTGNHCLPLEDVGLVRRQRDSTQILPRQVGDLRSAESGGKTDLLSYPLCGHLSLASHRAMGKLTVLASAPPRRTAMVGDVRCEEVVCQHCARG